MPDSFPHGSGVQPSADDQLIWNCVQAELHLNAAMRYVTRAITLCDHVVVRVELDAQGCQAKRIQEEDPDEW